MMALLAGLALAAPDAEPVTTPANLCLAVPACVLQPDRARVVGLSVNALQGRNRGFVGLELGGVHLNDGDAIGLRAGLLSATSGTAAGLHLAAVANRRRQGEGRAFGVFVGGLGNDAVEAAGVQVAPLLNNYARSAAPVLQVSALVNFVEERGSGAQLGLVNQALEEFVGLQIGGGNVANYYSQHVGSRERGMWVEHTYETTRWDGFVRGAQLALVANTANELDGLQVSLVNYNFARTRGVQVGALMNRAGHLQGVQAGSLNVARETSGLQLGLINVTGRLRGVQLGVLNFATKNKWPFMVGVLPGA